MTMMRCSLLVFLNINLNRRVVSSEVWGAKSVVFTATTAPVVRPTTDSFIYVDSASQNNLIYVNRVANVTANLSLSVSSSANRIGYFNTAKQLVSDAYMDVATVNNIGMLRVGTESSSIFLLDRTLPIILVDLMSGDYFVGFIE